MVDILQSTQVQLGIFIIAMVLILSNLIVKLAMIKAGIYRKYNRRRINGSSLKSGLWVLGFALLIVGNIYYDLGGWLTFWLVIAMTGLIQVIGALFGKKSFL